MQNANVRPFQRMSGATPEEFTLLGYYLLELTAPETIFKI